MENMGSLNILALEYIFMSIIERSYNYIADCSLLRVQNVYILIKSFIFVK